MTLQPLSQLLIPEMTYAGTAFTSMLIDASGEKAAACFSVPKTGNITHIGFRTGIVTTSDTLRVTLQTIDATTGDPSGSAYGGMVKGTQASLSSNTWYEVALGTQASATMGDQIAAVIEYDSYVAGNLNISYATSQISKNFPYIDLYTTSWTKTAGTLPVISLKYDDGNYYDAGLLPITAFNTQAFNSGSTPDERALKFKFPYPVRVKGAWVYVSIGSTADFDIVLYDSNGTSVLQTKSVDANIVALNGNRRVLHILFPATQTLSKDTFYYLSVKPTTANNVTFDDFSVNSAGVLDAISGGQNFYLSTRTDAGSWTDTTTKRPWSGLILDAFDDGASGGSSFTYNITE